MGPRERKKRTRDPSPPAESVPAGVSKCLHTTAMQNAELFESMRGLPILFSDIR